ncbi:MAG: amidase [Desulfobacterales bacterium]|nr:amidase [Desulfobacterales bacterium]
MEERKKDKIWQMDAMEMVHAIQNREITCEETIAAHLERIEAVNPNLNAITRVLPDKALEAARKADALLEKGEPTPPLLGLPITVKENIDCQGSPTTFGVPVLSQAMPGADAPHVALLKKAGAIVIGRTNLPDLGLRPHTDNALHGPTLNPWDPGRTPGGSSGGDAVAVASGMVPLGIGNDYGGSLRQPACFCGVTALRPGYGRIPDHMSLLPEEPAPTMQLFMAQGPIVRSANDLLPVLQCMAQSDPRDPRWTPAPFLKPGNRPRVALCPHLPGSDLAPSVKQAIEKAANALIHAGYEVTEALPPGLIELQTLWFRLTSAELQAFTLPNARAITSPNTLKFLDHWVEMHPRCSPEEYMAGLGRRNALAREWMQFQQRYPLILGPVVSTPPFPVDKDIESRQSCSRLLEGYALTMAANVLGLPALAQPVGVEQGLPLGIQILALRFHEVLCIEAAQAIEARLGGMTPVMDAP